MSKKIKVIGIGVAGCNVITRMFREQGRGVEFTAMSTDAQHLCITEASVRVQIGEKITHGLGAGGNPLVGQKAVEEKRDYLLSELGETQIVIIVAGMGGGTGTGAAPIVAELARQSGVHLIIAIVSSPFAFEGTHRMKVAEEGIKDLKDKVDTLVIIPNDRLVDLCDPKTWVNEAFKLGDEVMMRYAQHMLATMPYLGVVEVDVDDIRKKMGMPALAPT